MGSKSLVYEIVSIGQYMTHKIMLVDDHPLFRMGLKLLLEKEETFSVVVESDSPSKAWKEFQENDIELVICDLSFPNESGLSLVKNIRTKPSSCPVLILSMHNEGFWAERVLQEGVNGYLMKDENIGSVIEAAKAVIRGEIYLSSTIQQKILRQISQNSTEQLSIRELSKREMEIFRCMTKDLTTTEIAKSLFISVKTVQTHQSNIKKKLKVESISELRQLASKYVDIET